MLMLKRRLGEEIVINEHTRIRIVRIDSKSCQIGIEAPQSDHIRRGEIAPLSEDILQQTAEAIGVTA
jgi:carbon storage regulator CsrA